MTGLFVLYVIAHLALIELGREIVILHKWVSEGAARPTRLWIVEDGETAWLHHGYPDSAWIARLERDPVVTLERAGSTRRYRATPDPGSHDRVHQLLREKYGIADWWVRFVTGSREHCPALPVRLEPNAEIQRVILIDVVGIAALAGAGLVHAFWLRPST